MKRILPNAHLNHHYLKDPIKYNQMYQIVAKKQFSLRLILSPFIFVAIQTSLIQKFWFRTQNKKMNVVFVCQSYLKKVTHFNNQWFGHVKFAQRCLQNKCIPTNGFLMKFDCIMNLIIFQNINKFSGQVNWVLFSFFA